MIRSFVRLAAFATSLALPAVAQAGGYDTPMLYSARHLGMGGTAIGYVKDPSAMFHNPAGLGHIERGEVIGDFSLLLGKIHASPGGLSSGKDIDSTLTVAPFFLVGGGYRIHRMITIGLGVYPIASAGATFKYGLDTFENHTTLLFMEASPGIAFNPLPNLRFGLGYRVTYVRLNRYEGDRASNTPNIDFTMSGQNFAGFRVGAQYDILPWWSVGAVYRNKVRTKIDASSGVAFDPFNDISTHFVLPAKLGFGTRVDFDRFRVPGSLAVDFEYGFNSQNKGEPLVGTPVNGGGNTSVANLFQWKDSQTVKVGAEYRVAYDAAADLYRVPLRIGWVYDTKTANERYPTPFGTPPGPTQVFTAGSGYNGGKWQANVAYAYRFGSGAVTDPDTTTCKFCSYAGKDDYKITMHGIYVDGSVKF